MPLKFPSPSIFMFKILFSPAVMLVLSAFALILKFPTTPEKLSGLSFSGNAFTNYS